MKKLIAIILFLGAAKIHAQYSIVSDSIKKAGIYRTFEEFRDNNPSIVLDFKIVSEVTKYGPIANRSSLRIYKIDFPSKMSENIGNVFGFCDGKNAYIVCNTPTLLNYLSFFKVEHIDRYCVFECAYESLLALDSVYFRTGGFKILNLHNGDFLILNKKNLKKIIKDNVELSARFDKELNQNDVLKKYLLEYLEN
jgi:hypothetical protein